MQGCFPVVIYVCNVSKALGLNVSILKKKSISILSFVVCGKMYQHVGLCGLMSSIIKVLRFEAICIAQSALITCLMWSIFAFFMFLLLRSLWCIESPWPDLAKQAYNFWKSGLRLEDSHSRAIWTTDWLWNNAGTLSEPCLQIRNKSGYTSTQRSKPHGPCASTHSNINTE